MTPTIYRILGAVCCLVGAGMIALNLTRTANYVSWVVPILLIILGARQLIRARNFERRS